MKKLIICGTPKDVRRIIENLCKRYGGETTIADFIYRHNRVRPLIRNKEEVFLC